MEKTAFFSKKILKSNYILMLIFSILLLLLFSTYTISEAKIWKYKQITNNENGDRNPRVSSKMTVWNGYTPEGKYAVLGKYHNSDEIIHISNGLKGHFGMPAVFEDTVVFRSFNRTTELQEYYIWKNGIAKKIIENNPGPFPTIWGYPPSYGSIEPTIWGKEIAVALWDGNDYEIFTYNGIEWTQITDNDVDDYEPMIHLGNISWTSSLPGDVAQEVFLWDGQSIKNMSGYMKSINEDSNLFGTTVAFTGRAYYANDSSFDIFINRGDGPEPVYYLPYNDYHPSIYQNIITWENQNMSAPSRTNYKAYVYDGYKLDQLAINSFDHIKPVLYEDIFAMSVWDGNDYEILLASYAVGTYQTTRFEGYIRKVWPAEELAFVAHGSGGLKIFDTSDHERPFKLSEFRFQSEVFDVVVDQGLAYLACRESGIFIVDVQNPSSPEIIGSLDTPGSASAIILINQHLLVADTTGDLLVINVQNPAEPILTKRLDLPGIATGLFTHGTILYVANYSHGFSVVDISNIANPVLIKSIKTSLSYKLAVDDKILLTSNPSNKLMTWDVTNPSNPIQLGELNLPEGSLGGWKTPYEIAIIGKHAFIACGYQGVLVVDYSEPNRPEIVERYQTTDLAWSLSVQDDFLYVANGKSGFKIYNISDYLE